MNTKLIQDHDDKCCMAPKLAAGQIAHPWWLDTDNIQATWRDVNGGYHGETHAWIKLLCEDPHCPAQALIKLDWLLSQAQRELEAQKVAA